MNGSRIVKTSGASISKITEYYTVSVPTNVESFGNLVQETASAQLKEFNGVYLRNYSPENRKVHRGQAALALKQLKQLHARCAVCTHCSRKNSTYIPLKSIDKILACGKASGLGGCALGARE